MIFLRVKKIFHKTSRNSFSLRGLTYKDSGVDIAAGNKLVDMIKPLAKATARSGNLISEFIVSFCSFWFKRLLSGRISAAHCFVLFLVKKQTGVSLVIVLVNAVTLSLEMNLAALITNTV